MDLMEILKALFGDEALTFEQFAENVNNAADVRINLEHLDRICEVLNCNISEQFEYQPIRSKSTFSIYAKSNSRRGTEDKRRAGHCK